MAAPVITIFKNGDNHFQGKRLVVNRKEIRNFEALLDKITTDTRSQIAVRSLRTPNHGHRVEDVEKLENGGVYVAVGPERFKKLRYSEIRALPSNKQKSEEQIIKPVVHSRVVVSGRARKVAAAEHLSNRIIQVYRNGDDQNSALKILLDKRILKSMENVLQYISDKVNLRTGAVRSLYSVDGVLIQNANQIESGQQYVAVGFGKRFMKVNYSEGGSHSLTPRRAATKNSYSPTRSSKRTRPRRLKTHPQDKGSLKRSDKLPSLGGSNGPVKYPSGKASLPSKNSEPSSPRLDSDSETSPVEANTPASRKTSTESKSSANKSKQGPFHNSEQRKEGTFGFSSNETRDVDGADVVDVEEDTREDHASAVFKATGTQSEKAKAVRDDDDTQTEKPIDLVTAEEVEEEIETNTEGTEETRQKKKDNLPTNDNKGQPNDSSLVDPSEESDPVFSKGEDDPVASHSRTSSVSPKPEAAVDSNNNLGGKTNSSAKETQNLLQGGTDVVTD